MIPPTSIDGTDITGATIDGTDVQEITVDGDVVFSAREVPVIEYLIDEGSGTTLNNNVGTSNDATSSGSPTWVTDNTVRGGAYVDNLDRNNSFTINNSTTGIISENIDWTIGIELVVDSSLPNDSTFFAWGDGDSSGEHQFVIGTVDDGANEIASNHINSGSRVEKVSGPEPSPPYELDVVVTYDSSADNLRLYFDEVEQTGSRNAIRGDQVPMTIGTPNDSATGGLFNFFPDFEEGIAAFAFWDKIVDPSEFNNVG